MRRILALGATLAAVLSTLWAVTPAHATYPGTNGRLAYITQRQHIWQVFTMDPDGTHVSQVTHFAQRAASMADIDWSPDGTKLTFTREQSGDFDVWTVNADGSGLTNVTHDPKADEGGAHWSPDGTKLVLILARRVTNITAVYE